jgi:hypothetical protein
MWRFIKGVEEPSKKRKSTEDKLNYFKDYDKKRKRQYNMYLKRDVEIDITRPWCILIYFKYSKKKYLNLESQFIFPVVTVPAIPSIRSKTLLTYNSLSKCSASASIPLETFISGF